MRNLYIIISLFVIRDSCFLRRLRRYPRQNGGRHSSCQRSRQQTFLPWIFHRSPPFSCPPRTSAHTVCCLIILSFQGYRIHVKSYPGFIENPCKNACIPASACSRYFSKAALLYSVRKNHSEKVKTNAPFFRKNQPLGGKSSPGAENLIYRDWPSCGYRQKPPVRTQTYPQNKRPAPRWESAPAPWYLDPGR